MDFRQIQLLSLGFNLVQLSPLVITIYYTTYFMLFFYRYSVMLRCWAADPEERPTFAELRITFDIMMSNQRTESYVDLNVDDLLPYYQMKPAEEEEEEEEEGSPTLSLPHPSAWLPMDPPDDTVVHITDNTSIDEPVF